MTPNLYTTNIAVSQRIKELVGEMESYLVRKNFEGSPIYRTEEYADSWESDLLNIFTLSELPEVLKKVGGKLGWTVERQHLEWVMVCGYLFHEDNVGLDNYLMELLK